MDGVVDGVTDDGIVDGLADGIVDGIGARLVDGVDVLVDGGTLTLRATRGLAGLRSTSYAEPRVAVELELGLSDDAEFLGFAFTQFAMPVVARRDQPFDFAPAPNLRSPSVVLPLLVRDGVRHVLLAPLAGHHEQVITVLGGRVRWGWHGDLDEVPAGFSTVLGRYDGAVAAELFEAWGADLRGRNPVTRRPRAANAVTSRLSYWTDNGAAYWYRTEANQTIADSVVNVVADLLRSGVPIGAVELDSWFYRHEHSRAIAEIGYPDEVPPSGMMEWQPRADAFADIASAEPVRELAARCGDLALVLHARHVAASSPYVDDAWWVDRSTAQPRDPAFFRRWFDDAVRWGATCIEQDWMLLYWFGVREMRRVSGRAHAWQAAMNEHARATDVDLIWCMATPADLIAAVEFERVVAVRTSDDYRFADDPALLWTWFLTVNRLVAPLGLWPFKDCFFSNAEPDPADSISGDIHADVEALLSAMSGGPVGIGDRIGRTDRSIVMRTCDDDGRLLQPDVPIGLIDDCLFGAPARGERLAWATACTTRDGQTWTYVIAINTATDRRPIADTLALTELAISDPRHVYDWRQGTAREADRLHAELQPRDWALYVICPPGSIEIGDVSKYVTVASRI
jgi:hypothetical protein